MQTFPIIKEKGHIIIDIDGKRALIDTGAPFTFGSGDFQLCGKSYTPLTNFMGNTIESICKLSGMNFDILIGNDVLSKQNIRIRWKEGFIDFGDDIDEYDYVQQYNNFMGVIVFPIKISGQDTNAILDTGAFISYISDDLVLDREKSEEIEDFHPLAGRYKTDIYIIPVCLNVRDVELQFGT
ncbi:MAG: hypothetical protein N2999_07600, partial [Proteobacteria bacterium]|nr:hypothetical protein [Pseudomonadota bacterium]